MMKIALMVALAMIAASQAVARQKKTKRGEAGKDVCANSANEGSYRLVRDSLPIVAAELGA